MKYNMKHKKAAVFFMTAALAALLAGCGMAGRTAKQETGGSSQKEQTDRTNAGDAEKEETEESQAVSYKEREDLDPDKCLDENGNPTIYALSQLNGAELVEFMEDHGFAWQEDERRWQLSQENERLAACFSRVGVMKEELNEMPKGGQGADWAFLMNVNGYDTEEAMLAAQQVEIVDSCRTKDSYGSDNGLAAIVKTPDSCYYTVSLFHSKDGDMRLYLTGEEAALHNGETKAVAYQFDSRNLLGLNSLEEIWEKLSGRSLQR